VSRWQKLPWVSYVHGWTQENRKILFYNWTEKMMVRKSDRIIAVSQNMKDRLQLGSKIASKSLVIKNSLTLKTSEIQQSHRTELLDYRFQSPEHELMLLAVGRLSPEKGFIYLLRAVELLSLEISHLKLILVGDGPEKKNLVSEAQRLKISDKVVFAGTQKNLRPYFEMATIYCQPSLSEGIPLSILEAMASQKAIVATRVGGIPEVIQDGIDGILIDPRDPMALKRALQNLWQSPDIRSRLGKAARLEIERNYSSRNRTRRIFEIYDQLLNSFHRHERMISNTNSDYKVAQGATEGGTEACSLQAAPDDRPSNDGIRSKRNWYK